MEPWYKQFWPWFIISLPASAVVAGIITVFIAFDGADSLVVDDYYKSGLAINGQFQLQRNAANSGYSAILKRMPDNRLFLKFDNATPAAESLTLKWIHPADSKKDFSLIMKKQTDGSYQTRSAQSFSGRWYLRLSEKDRWLLKSEISTGKDTVHLTPKVN
ncbi:MAG: hypothetical protein DRQ47_05685 [Gammaproteobacteria bacterium]|nr:MAG: hypothetical protein DRQ47_05685 [Gammaproteobacteria bacterium]